MSTTQFEYILECYVAALITLEEAGVHPSAEQILQVLVARDVVHTALIDKTPEISKNLMTVIKLDSRLKEQSDSISQAVKLADWRASLAPKKEAWWWYFETPPHLNKWNRFDWLWSALTILCLTIALSLAVDISSRFLSGGPDMWAAFAVITQSILTMLAAGGALTKMGQEVIKRILSSLNIPEHFWQEVRLVLAILLLLGFISFRFSLHRIAIYYNNRGIENYLAGRLTSAQYDYSRALRLKPDYAEAHYNLGLLYEDLQDFKRAKAEYQVAVGGGLDAAYNNLAHLYILDETYSVAVSLLLDGLDLTQDDQVRYDMLKNMGWAWLKQGRYAEAEVRLQEAIDLAQDKAPAHCLLAQVMNVQSKTEKATAEWESCLKFADGRDPDQIIWIDMARQYLYTTEEHK